ncbi:hypothetical protein SNE40_019910 [Patella caerulea]|uniref:Uncharacterized protein n=1 Tax=Patella caerulea TaxID=87958 RepID=A0AAN8IZZ6_PATCE
MFILDIPGAAKELGHMQQNAIMACPWCNTEGCYASVLGKTVYCDSRRFLEMNDPMRRETCFPSNCTETRPPPRPRDMNRVNQIS